MDTRSRCRYWSHVQAGGTLVAVLCAPAMALFAQTKDRSILQLDTGQQIYEAACVACHGPDGKGMPKSTAGFEPPRTFPDFTRCDQTTPELNKDWRAVILNGGAARGFSPIMPSFSEALTPEQITKVIDYLRTFCSNPSWPRGELNLPLALGTEKAYPEDEVVLKTTLNAQGAPGVTNQAVYEQRFGVRNQIEVTVPFTFQHQNQTWYGGVGDMSLGLKRELFSSLRSGSILSVQGEAILPNGNKARALGRGVTTFETFVAFGQLFPNYSFLQFQAGAELPTHTKDTPRAVYWRTVLGQTLIQNRGLGRMWSPMVEFLADRDLTNGARTNWDILPEMQVTISRRQHIRANAGVRIPLNNTAGRPVQVVFYVLWDWLDGRLTEGW